MDIVITGASGFLGRNVLLEAPDGWNILAIYHNDRSFPGFAAGIDKRNIVTAQCDLTDPEQVTELFQRHGVRWDCCLHLAAKVDIPWSVREPRQELVVNCGSLLNVLSVLRARTFVYFSSGAVYDGLSGEVRPEAQLAPTLPYAVSKLTSERYVKFHKERIQSIENYMIVRFFGAYGPYEARHKIFTRVVENFALRGSSSFTIYGGGETLSMPCM